MNGLLNRTLLYYTFFATVILLASSPFFYWMIKKLYIDDVDEAILLRKKEFILKNQADLKKADIVAWNRFNRDTRILPDTGSAFPGERIVQQIFYDEMSPEWEPYRVLYTKVMIQGSPWILMIRLNLVESEDFVKTLTWLYCTILFTLLIVIFFITRFTSNRLWKPFNDTLCKITQFNLEHQSAPVLRPTSIREFTELNRGLEKLMAETIKTYQSQKEFTENAAHELQTPLAVFQSKLDMLLQDPSLTGTQAAILNSLYEASSRLTRVNRNLLLLAKIENHQFTAKEPVNVEKLIADVLPYFSGQAQLKNLEIVADINKNVSLNASRSLLEILISNLILNAVRHNRQDGSIDIRLQEKELIVMNTSEHESLNQVLLFKRFARRLGASSNTGLGLAIVKSICEYHNWQIRYFYQPGCHFFAVSF